MYLAENDHKDYKKEIKKIELTMQFINNIDNIKSTEFHRNIVNHLNILKL